MNVYESDLPGVGKKFEIDLDDSASLVVVVHNTGKREVFIKTERDADSEKLFELPDRLARTVGTILEGTYFQPVQAERVRTMLAEGTLLEWYNVDAGSELVGHTIAEAGVRERTGASIVAIQRGDDVLPSPDPGTTIHAEDTVVVIGSREDIRKFEALISGNATDE